MTGTVIELALWFAKTTAQGLSSVAGCLCEIKKPPGMQRAMTHISHAGEASARQFASFHDGEARQVGEWRRSSRRLRGRSEPTPCLSALVSLKGSSAVLGFHFMCGRRAYFSSSIGPLRTSTRPYFLLRIEISKNSSWLSDCIRLTVCWSSSRFSRSICPFSRLPTNSVR